MAVAGLDHENMPRWKQYPKYKDTGIEWLGQVPEHWLVQRLKTAATHRVSNVDKVPLDGELPVRLCNYSDVYYSDFITPQMELMEATATAEEVKKFGLEVGDTVITKDSESWDDIAIPALVTETAQDLVCGYHLAIVRPDTRYLVGRYLFRALQAGAINHQFQIAATGVTRYGLPKSAIGEALVVLPPVQEQTAIADFLDKKMTGIDQLIAKRQRLVELLEEKRQALITHAVTKGLNPNAPMKDSGMERPVGIPKHWDVQQLRRVVKRFVDYRGRTPEKTADGVPLITARNVKNGVIDFDLSQEYIAEEDYAAVMARGTPEIGDVIVTTEAPLGEAAQIVDTGIALAQRIILFKANTHAVINEYLKYYLLSAVGQAELWSRSSGSTAIGIKASHLKEVLVTVPPIEEQMAIVQCIDRTLPRLAALAAKVEQHLALLRDHRASLISAAVTGRIDVREVTA